MSRRRFTPRLVPRLPFRRRRYSAAAAPVALAFFGFAAVSAIFGGHAPSTTATAQVAAVSTAGEQRVAFTMCGRHRVTCVVDGDTIWLNGVNLRLESYDTPEPYNQICGGAAEVALAHKASARLLQLLNGNGFTVDYGSQDRYGRTLATLRIGGRDVGDILIEEGLARSWPDGDEFWC